ncbi:MAG TPA: hypothetical protein VGB55_01225 [Tepidisphaeraceae bacterium]
MSLSSSRRPWSNRRPSVAQAGSRAVDPLSWNTPDAWSLNPRARVDDWLINPPATKPWPNGTGFTRHTERVIRQLSDPGEEGQRARYAGAGTRTSSTANYNLVATAENRANAGRVFVRQSGAWVHDPTAIEGDMVLGSTDIHQTAFCPGPYHLSSRRT